MKGMTRSSKVMVKKKVMVVDDHPIVRQGLAQLINQEDDIEVCCEAENMKNALLVVEKFHPDVAIVDIALGESTGVRLIKELSEKYQDMPILALSMHDESLYAERCLRAGAKGYIMKKEPPERVISALMKILAGEVYVSDNLGSKLLNKLVGTAEGTNSSPVDQLSNRELEVYELYGKGLKTREIAERLSLSVKTIETYVDHIKKKMKFKDSRDLLMHAVQSTMGEDAKKDHT